MIFSMYALGKLLIYPSLKLWSILSTHRSACAIKLLTTRPSSIFMRGPYVLKILAIRISVKENRGNEIQETNKE